jgi:flagellar motility protein MotE (MotC chaperone)
MSSRKVSRRTIYNRIENNQLTTIKENNKLYIIEENLATKKGSVTKNQVSNLLEVNSKLLKEIQKEINGLIMLSNEFDYKLIRERLVSLDNANINLFNKVDTISKYKIDENFSLVLSQLEKNTAVSEALSKKVDDIDERMRGLEEKFEHIYEHVVDFSEKFTILFSDRFGEKTEREKKKLINIFNKK